MVKKQKKNRSTEKIANARQAAGRRRSLDIGIIAGIALATLLIIISIGQLPYNRFTKGMTGATVTYELARVDRVLSESLQDSGDGLMTGTQSLLVKMITGRHKGETVQASNALSTYNSVLMKEGKFVIVNFDELDSGQYGVYVYNYFRAPLIALLAAIFLGALILVGGRKGLMAGLGLAYTFVCVLLVFLPLVLRGYSPIFAAILLVTMVTSVTMVLLNGVTKKSLSAILGTVSGALVAGVILFVFGKLMHISGYSTDDAEALILIGQTTGLKVKDLLFAGLLIASLGAIMDVAISIVSSIHELTENKSGLGTKELFRSAMNVGRDMIGTMSNTLILAFTGTSLSLMILLYSYAVQFNQLMNMNTMSIEIVQALAGSLGIIFTVPITAMIAARLYVKTR